MTNTKDWVLPNGGTFLASTAGIHGTWAKATDPVTLYDIHLRSRRRSVARAPMTTTVSVAGSGIKLMMKGVAVPPTPGST